MAVTLVVNVFVVATSCARPAAEERGAARRREAHAQRRADVGAVLGALIGVWLGYPAARPAGGAAGGGVHRPRLLEIAQEASRILADEIVIAEAEVRDGRAAVPEVIGCEKIRTRGSADYVFLDLHIWLDGDMPLAARTRRRTS